MRPHLFSIFVWERFVASSLLFNYSIDDMKGFCLVFALLYFTVQINAKPFLGKAFGWLRKHWYGRNMCFFEEEKLNIRYVRKYEKHCEYFSEKCLLGPLFCRETRCKTITRRPLVYYYERPRYKKECCPGWKSVRSSRFRKVCSEVHNCFQLSQFTPERCEKNRTEGLERNRQIYRLTKPATTIPNDPVTVPNIHDFLTFPLLNASFRSVIGLTLQTAFEKEWAQIYLGMSQKNNLLAAQGQNEFTKYSDYENLLEQFRQAQHSGGPFDAFFTFPSQEEDEFKDIITNEVWKDDEVFVDQRLSGLNPFSLRKLTSEEYEEVKERFNPDIDEAISNVAGNDATMNEMVKKGLVFILDYPLLHGLTNVEDITDRNTSDQRNMRYSKSPVAIFLSVKHGSEKKNKLKAVGIQLEFNASSPLLTPEDKSKWMLAKLEVQRADFYYLELVEHLLKRHFLMEVVAVTMHRTLSTDHPLNEILKYHCRGTMLVNSVSLPALLGPKSQSHHLLAIGHIGSIELLNRAYKNVMWDDTDFPEILKRRGVDDPETLPYFPFRDDGLLVYSVVKSYAKNIVNLYYKNDEYVVDDEELQNFANEISADGTGEYGGAGNLRGFPAEITSKIQLADVLCRIIFTVVSHHAANYPVAYYGGFVPNMPTKIYDDPRVPPGEYNFHSLPRSHVAALQVGLSMTLGALRYDQLFDYGPAMRDPETQRVVEKTFKEYLPAVDKIIAKRNEKRFEENHSTYPYFLSKYMPNSIHT